MISTNYLVIVSGISGLTFAIKIARMYSNKNIVIVIKGDEGESNTKYAQGGVTVVLDFKEDSFQKHIQDTLIAGDRLCDTTVVEMVVKEGPLRFKELIDRGNNFDLDSQGNFDLKHRRHMKMRDNEDYLKYFRLLNRMNSLAFITSIHKNRYYC